MKVVNFCFRPDDHYAYPELDEISETSVTPMDIEGCIQNYIAAGYSVIDLDIDVEEPDRDDFESDEEYDAAYAEYEEAYNEQEEAMKRDFFWDYGDYDLYTYRFIIAYEEPFTIEPKENAWDTGSLRGWFYSMDSGETECRDENMKGLSKEQGVIFIIGVSEEKNNTIIYMNGEIKNTIDSSLSIGDTKDSSLLNIMGDEIIDNVNNNNILNASKLFSALVDLLEGLDEYVKTRISEEDYNELISSSKGYSIMDRYR